MATHPAKDTDVTVVTKEKVESGARKLTQFTGRLPESERAVMRRIMERAAAVPCWFPRPQMGKTYSPHNHHTVVISGQADGIVWAQFIKVQV